MKTLIPNLLAPTSLALAALVADGPAQAQLRTSPSASADCALRIDTGATNWIIRGYDPFADSNSVATFDIVYDNQGGAACVFDPVFVTDQAPFGLVNERGQTRASYTLLDQSRNQAVTPVSGRTIVSATRQPVVVQPHRQQLVRYQFVVDTDMLSYDGLYTQRVTLTAESRQHQAALASRSLVLGIDVVPSAVLGLAGAYRRNGSQALVDLGELTEGVSPVPLALRVSSTRAYRLEFDSKNNGFLQMEDADWKIPYQLAVDDQMLALAGPQHYLSTDNRPTTDSLPLRFVIGDVDGKRAGRYSDVVTVSISPR